MDATRRVMPRPKRGTCTVCGRAMRVTKAGVLGHHSDLSAPKDGMPWHPVCRGVGKPPTRYPSEPVSTREARTAPVVAAESGGEEGQ
jgi:hypothetical protein